MNCDCIEKIDKGLMEKNLRLSGYAFTMPDFKVVPTVNTEWIDPSKAPKGMKNKPQKVFASHCPFCGKAVEASPAKIKTDEDKGLYQKFRVERTDGSSAPGGKHEKCRYFVLDLEHDRHASAALRTYANRCVSDHPQLAHDLLDLVHIIEQERAAKTPGE